MRVVRRPLRRAMSMISIIAVGAAVAVTATAGASASRPRDAASASPHTLAVVTPAGRVAAGGASHSSRLRQVKHVFTIVLENEDYAKTFGAPKQTPYLAKTLRRKGLLLEDYYGTGHESNDNYISLVSGQAPNTLNQADCQDFVDFPSVDVGRTTLNEPHQQLGPGCVYPADIADIGTQLTAKHLSWKGYMQDMGNDATRESAACGHPAIGSQDKTQTAETGDGYATRHDPFVYFHSVINHQAYCQRHVVALGSATGKLPKNALPGETGLARDLKHESTTPDYSFITPNLCDDGHDFPCRNGEKSLGSATADIDRWLAVWVPKILHSPAYRDNGLIEITFDESDGAQSDSTACCGESFDPNAADGNAGAAGPGGGKIGALLISPFIKPGTSSTHGYNHYSTLATDEAIFGLKRLGYAATAHRFAVSLFHRGR